MSAGEHGNRIEVWPSYELDLPWASVGSMPMDAYAIALEHVESLRRTLKNTPHYEKVDQMGIAMSEEEKRGGIYVAYHSPGFTKVINHLIAETMGMEGGYELDYKLKLDTHEKKTAEEIWQMDRWLPY